ncbi:hypothetical protein ACFYMB_29990 [Micromonospora haikouensis]|uniref:hypothetical protein n=1 Tax=Micromonospora haikouensis TaxID=686309 RepID=UPI0036A95556
MLANLGLALRARFEAAGDEHDLDEAIRVERRGVTGVPEDHPHRADYLADLSLSLRVRYERLGMRRDIDERSGPAAGPSRPHTRATRTGRRTSPTSATRCRPGSSHGAGSGTWTRPSRPGSLRSAPHRPATRTTRCSSATPASR